MKTSGYISRTLAAAVLGCLSFSAAKAQQVDYTIVNSEADLETFNVSYNSSGYNTLNNNIGGALTGGIQIALATGANQHGTSIAGLPSSYTTVCTDIGASVYLGSTYGYDLDTYAHRTGVDPAWGLDANGNFSVTGTAQGAALPASLLLGEQQAAIQNAAHIFYNNLSTYDNTTHSGGIAGTPSQMAAVQLAVWAAVYDTTINGNVAVTLTGSSGSQTLSGGRFSVTGADQAAIVGAYNLLTGLTGNYNLTGNLLFPDPNNTQGNGNGEPVQELLMQSGLGTPVPEPTTMVAGALLLLPFGLSTLRMLRKSPAA